MAHDGQELERSADPKSGAPGSHLCITLVRPVVEDLLLILQLFHLVLQGERRMGDEE